jgi:multidrug efflux system membrane fusion protein
VTVASTGDDGAVVTAGVKPGDRVVVEGQLRLKDGSAIREGKPGGDDAAAGNG